MSTPEGFNVPGPGDAYATPLDSPLYGPPPARFRDGEVVTIQYRSDPAAVRLLLPEPLQPINDVVMVQVSRWGDVPGLGRDTYECNVMVAAALHGATTTVGSYSPYFYVGSDRAMAGGREFHGQPKRHAEVRLEHRGDLVVATVAANGIEFFVGTLPYKARAATFADLRQEVDPVTNINLKILHEIDGRTAVRQLTARDLTDIVVGECWSGPSTAELRPHATCPLYRLPVRSFLAGYYWTVEFSLTGGRVLHNYEQ